MSYNLPIPKDTLRKYDIAELDWYKERHGDTKDTEVTFYKTFLLQTDYIPSKMMEAQLSGETLDEDYTPILQYRKLAREQVNLLGAEIQADNNASLKRDSSNAQET